MYTPKDLQTALTVLMRTLDGYGIPCEYSVDGQSDYTGLLYGVKLTCFLRKSYLERIIPYRESYNYSTLKKYFDEYLNDVLARHKYENSF